MPFSPSDKEMQDRVQALKEELQNRGWTAGADVEFDERWTTDNMDLVRANAANLVELKPDVIVALGGRVIPVLMQLTRTVPIIIPGSSDSRRAGYIKSLARPGGNVTGFATLELSVIGKILETLKQIAPGTSRVAMIYNPDNLAAINFRRPFESFALPLSIQPIIAPIHSIADIERAIEALAEQPNGGVFFPPDVTTFALRDQITAIVARHRVPAIYADRSLRDQRRPRFLRRGSHRHISPHRVLRRPCAARRKTRRSTVSAADEIPTHDQPQNRQGARPHRADYAARHRRRGDRMSRPDVRFWHKADIGLCTAHVCF